MPLNLPCGENWQRQYQAGTLSVGVGRKKEVEEIAKTLIASKTIKVHPLLLGESRAGKTETVKALVKAIENGEYPELKGKTVFYINTADLTKKEKSADMLNSISEMMGRHRDNIILIFDNIHVASQTKNGNLLADRLKTLLDEGSGSFPYVIGITTREEFDRDINSNNSAFTSFFKKIAIHSTDLCETIQILKQSLWKNDPKILVTSDGLESLILKTNKAFGEKALQPSSSLRVLSLCIRKAAETQKSSLELKIEKMRNRIDFLYLKRSKDKKERGDLERQLELLKSDLKKEKSDLELFYQDKDRLAELRKATYEASLKLEGGGSESAMNQFIFYDQFLIPSMERKLLEKAQKLGVKVIIDAELIDEVIREEKETIEKAQ